MRSISSQLMKVKSIDLDPQTVFTSCYCSECKQPLSESRVLDSANAWCPDCQRVVATSWFRIPSWIVGIAVVVVGMQLWH